MKNLLLALLTVVFLISCSHPSSGVPPKLKPLTHQFANEDEQFRLVLHIDKLEFRSDEKILLHSTLEYIGTEQEMTIWHGLPYINYVITNGKDFRAGGVASTILTSTTLKKGEVYTFPYIKNGAFAEEAPDADFWREFYKEKDLYLAPGKYTVTVYCAFSLTDDVVNSKYHNQVEIEITVE
ncbi:hypothetical protein [Cohnella hongkongensis]|uniref:DUF4625 domain-containing protein n=1 Tax=Cohnella hongkongensis TaxID=178337 RepID=A0ABV9FKS2_9BACL